MFARYLQGAENTLGGGFRPLGEGFRANKNLAVSCRRVITPRIVNELTAGFSRFNLVHPRRGEPRFSECCGIFAANCRLPVHAVQPELLRDSTPAEPAEHR